ncbi:PEP-CTERM sorting domain-containing protein [Chamaesiphon sp. OTE_75_metabat_556]
MIGPGNVSAATAAPEPFTIIGTLVGGTAAIRMRKKLKSVNKG